MHLSRISLKNFRNFSSASVELGKNVIVVGENKAGKSNLVYAIRLVLDNALPESQRRLRIEDIWSGIGTTIPADTEIEIAIDFTDFGKNKDLLGILGLYELDDVPGTARIIYVCRAKDKKAGIRKDTDLEYTWYGKTTGVDGLEIEKTLRQRIRIDVIQALRDADKDLNNWRNSPARVLLESAISSSQQSDLERIAQKVSESNKEVLAVEPIKNLDASVRDMVKGISGTHGPEGIQLGMLPATTDKLVRAIRILIDNGTRSLGEESLGLSNVIYIGLKYLESLELIRQSERDFTLLAIEEPEAHLHPTLQRTVFSSLIAGKMDAKGEGKREISFLLTTHSPHIVSIAKVRSLVRLARTSAGSKAYSTASLKITAEEEEDLARYLDVTRGELVFAKGIIFVEGDAERFLVPAMAALHGFDLDALGIFVCSVSGTNFSPYVKLVGSNGLHIPFVVITDGDPKAPFPGSERLTALTEIIAKKVEPDQKKQEALGLFRNNDTLEIALVESGLRKTFIACGIELSMSKPMKARFEAMLTSSPTDREALLKDINAIGKGRFAQRLSQRVSKNSPAEVPGYIASALKFLIKAVQ
jgi:putative ATP-dependent endonuclease of OLD family